MNIIAKNKRINKKDIVILVPHWPAPTYFFNLVEKTIPRNFGYLSYYYTRDLLNPNPSLTKKYFLSFINKIIHDLRELNRIKKRNFYMYGHSLGGLFCMIVADKIDIKKLVLIAPGYNLAECFWNGNKTQDLKKIMEQDGITLKKLKILWKEISPDYYFKNKAIKSKYLIKLAKKDTIIPYKNGVKLVDLFKQKNIDFKLKIDNIFTHEFKLISEAIFPINTIKFFRLA